MGWIISLLSTALGPLRIAGWPIWFLLKGFFTTNGFLAALLIAGGVLAFQYDASRVKHGEMKEAARRDEINEEAVSIATRGRSGSGRVLDPYTRSE